MNVYIEADNLSKVFNDGFVAVDSLNLKVAKGEVLGFLGPNGSGKTTTMRMVTGYITPTSGSVKICGYSMSDDCINAKSCLGYLPEGSPLYSDLSPEMILSFVGKVRGMSRSFFKDRFDYVVETLHLKEVLKKTTENLSKGFKRRLGLAIAILHDPSVLILDEPTDGLDPVQKFEVRSLIRSLAFDKSIVISTHILEEVSEVCDQVAIISRGALKANETPASLIARSADNNTVVVEILVSEDPDSLKNDLLSYPEISDVTLSKIDSRSGSLDMGVSYYRVKVFPVAGNDVSSLVSKKVFQHGGSLISFNVQKGDLDEVFRSLVVDAPKDLGSSVNRAGNLESSLK